MSAETPGPDGQSFRAPSGDIDPFADAMAHHLGEEPSELVGGVAASHPRNEASQVGAESTWTASGYATEAPAVDSGFVIGSEVSQEPSQLRLGAGEPIVAIDAPEHNVADPAPTGNAEDPWKSIFTKDGGVKGKSSETTAPDEAPKPEEVEPATPEAVLTAQDEMLVMVKSFKELEAQLNRTGVSIDEQEQQLEDLRNALRAKIVETYGTDTDALEATIAAEMTKDRNYRSHFPGDPNDSYNKVLATELGTYLASISTPDEAPTEPIPPVEAAEPAPALEESESIVEPGEAEKAAAENGWKKGDLVGDGLTLVGFADGEDGEKFFRLEDADGNISRLLVTEDMDKGPHYEKASRFSRLAKKLGKIATDTPARYTHNKDKDPANFKVESTINQAKFDGMLQTNGEKGSKIADRMRKGKKSKYVMKAFASSKSERERAIFGATSLDKVDDLIKAEVGAAKSLGGDSEVTRVKDEASRMRATYEETLSRLAELQRNTVDKRVMKRIKGSENGKEKLAAEIQKNKDKLKALRKDIANLVP